MRTIILITGCPGCGSTMLTRMFHQAGGCGERWDTHDARFGVRYIKELIAEAQDNDVIKCVDVAKGMLPKVDRMPPPEPETRYKVIFLHRDHIKIMESLQRRFKWGSNVFLDHIQHAYDIIGATIYSREDMEVLEMSYEEIMDDPDTAFAKIRDFACPGFDVEHAKSMIERK